MNMDFEAIQRHIDKLVVTYRPDGLEALLVSTDSGVPLFHTGGFFVDAFVRASASSFFCAVEQQIRKMNVGAVRTATALHESATLIHINMTPLVLTLVANSGANSGSLRSIAPGIRDSLGFLKQTVALLLDNHHDIR